MEKNGTLIEVANELAILEQSNNLVEAIEDNSAFAKPLHFAIQSEKSEVVSLLLSHGAKVDTTALSLANQCSSKPIMQSILGELAFYDFIQKYSTEENPEIDKTLTLLLGAANSLAHCKPQKNVNFLFGLTGIGKSSLAHTMYGTDYQLKNFSDPSKGLLSSAKGRPEIAKPGHTDQSVTTIPQILPILSYDNSTDLKEDFIADLPGPLGNLGLPYEIAGAVGMQLLTKCFTHMRGFIVMLDANDFKSARKIKIQNTLDMVGTIINSRETLMPHLVVIINYADNSTFAADVIEKFAKMAKSIRTMKKSTRFVLEKLSPKQIFLIPYPSTAFRHTFLQYMPNIPSVALSEINFGSYHKELNLFKKIIHQLQNYHAEQKHLTYQIQHQQLEAIKSQLASSEITGLEFSVPHSLTALKQSVNEAIIIQQNLSSNLQDVYNKLSNLFNTARSELQFPEEKLAIMANLSLARYIIVDTFIQKLNPLLPLFNLSTPTSIEVKLPATGEELPEYRATSSWPLPGAQAAEFNLPAYRAYMADLQAQLNLDLDILLAMSGNTDKLTPIYPQIRQYAGMTQNSCAFQWPGIYSWILPRTTHITNGSPKVYGNTLLRHCQREEHILEMQWSGSNLRILLHQPAQPEFYLTIGEQDLRFLKNCGLNIGKGFMNGAINGFIDESFDDDAFTHLLQAAAMGVLYGPQAMLIHIGMWLLTAKLGLEQSRAGQVVLTLSTALAVLYNNSDESYIHLAFQLASTILGSQIGNTAGRFVSSTFFGPRRTTPIAQEELGEAQVQQYRPNLAASAS